MPKNSACRPPDHLAAAVLLLAILGGYQNRTHDPPPGHQIMWRGYERMSFFRGEEDLLTSILDPSAAFAPEYANYLVETEEGELLNGILAAETDAAVTLSRANGETDTVPRSRIRDLRAEGLSLMPDGLEQGLDADGLADLLAYLR